VSLALSAIVVLARLILPLSETLHRSQHFGHYPSER
jgi:hypothetical protein